MFELDSVSNKIVQITYVFFSQEFLSIIKTRKYMASLVPNKNLAGIRFTKYFHVKNFVSLSEAGTWKIKELLTEYR
jgi:hypothetical protein